VKIFLVNLEPTFGHLGDDRIYSSLRSGVEAVIGSACLTMQENRKEPKGSTGAWYAYLVPSEDLTDVSVYSRCARSS